MTTDLYTTVDVKEVREQLLKEQDKRCALTLLEIPTKQAVLDHCHKTQKVRAVLHRQANASLGKLEGIYTRYLSFWYPESLSTFLRQAAAYLENVKEDRWYHPGWLKKIQTKFNSLNETQKKDVLRFFELEEGSNAKERKESFKKLLQSQAYGFEFINDIVTLIKETP